MKLADLNHLTDPAELKRAIANHDPSEWLAEIIIEQRIQAAAVQRIESHLIELLSPDQQRHYFD